MKASRIDKDSDAIADLYSQSKEDQKDKDKIPEQEAKTSSDNEE